MVETVAKDVELDQKEKKELLAFFEKLDIGMLKTTATAISMMVRAFEGKPIEEDTVVSKLVDIKDIMQRSRFPTYPLIAKQVYLRLIALYNPNAYACKDWADLEAKALIAYKGQNWDAWIEMTKAEKGAVMPGQQFYFGEKQVAPTEPARKGHFWSRSPKPKEESEFEHQ